MADTETLPAAQEAQADPAMERVATLVQWRDAAEEATLDARKQSERDRDYYDNKQLTAAEINTLKKRGQPVIVKNRIKRKIDFLSGLEKRQRANPKATPRTPVEEQNAFAATDAIKYVVDDQEYAPQRSQAWRNMCIEGAAGFSVCVKPRYNEMCVEIKRIPWDRMFWDPHSSEADFSDAMYKGFDTWMDETEIRSTYKDTPDLDAILSAAYERAPGQSDTYEDKPKSGVWADRKRKRIRISTIWFRPHGQWHYAEFTKGGLLKGGLSPYQDEDREPDCELIYQSAYVDRDNNRYGVVREMIGPQDEVNKRSSKALHMFTARQARVDPRTGLDPNEVQKQLARPDGVVAAGKDEFEILPNGDQAEGQLLLLQEAKAEIDLMGANADLLGDNRNAPSGKAIELNQNGGLIEMGDLLDGLRHLDARVFRAVWNRIRQFWTEEKWIPVTDDESNIRFVGMNVGMETKINLMRQYADGLPQNLSVLNRPVGELDVDITIESTPDTIDPMREQFEGMVRLAEAGIQLPPYLIVESMPNLRNREKVLQAMQEQAEQQANQPNPEMLKIIGQMQVENQKMQLQAQKQQTDAALEVRKQDTEAELEVRSQDIKAQTDQQKNAVAAVNNEQKNQISAHNNAQKNQITASKSTATAPRGRPAPAPQPDKSSDFERMATMSMQVIAEASRNLSAAANKMAFAATASKRVIRDASGQVIGVEAAV